MNAQELRLYNLLSYAGQLVYVLGIKQSYRYMIPSHSIELGYFRDSVGFERRDCDPDISPILLTEEWLKRFGFEKEVIEIGGPAINEPADEWSLNGYRFMFDINGKLFLTGYNWNTEHMPYVHTLQNLFYFLSGEELTIS